MSQLTKQKRRKIGKKIGSGGRAVWPTLIGRIALRTARKILNFRSSLGTFGIWRLPKVQTISLGPLLWNNTIR
jgi:hypothetical protein